MAEHALAAEIFRDVDEPLALVDRDHDGCGSRWTGRAKVDDDRGDDRRDDEDAEREGAGHERCASHPWRISDAATLSTTSRRRRRVTSASRSARSAATVVSRSSQNSTGTPRA